MPFIHFFFLFYESDRFGVTFRIMDTQPRTYATVKFQLCPIDFLCSHQMKILSFSASISWCEPSFEWAIKMCNSCQMNTLTIQCNKLTVWSREIYKKKLKLSTEIKFRNAKSFLFPLWVPRGRVKQFWHLCQLCVCARLKAKLICFGLGN